MIAPTVAARTPVMRGPEHHDDPPFQPPVGTLTYLRKDGTARTFRVMPFVHEKGDWPTPYASMADALRAASSESADWMGGVTFGVVRAADGALQIRPMESENGKAFPIDGPMLDELGLIDVQATGTDDTFLALVGPRRWIDLGDPANRTDVRPKPLPAFARR